MSPTISLALRAAVLSTLFSVAGCGPSGGEPEPVGRQVFECPTASASGDLPADRPGGPPSPPVAPAVLAFDEGGALGVLDPGSGEALALEPVAAAAPGALERDVAYDPSGARALVFESDDEGQSGAIRVVPLAAGGLGPSEHRAWVDGRARVLGVPGAVAEFELGYGQRWKLLRDDGLPAPSLPAPPPASAWLTAGAPPSIEGLVAEDGASGVAWSLARASVAGGALGAITSVRLDLGGGEIGAALASRWPAGDGLLLAWLADGALRFGRLDEQGAALASWVVGPRAGRLIALAPLAPRPGGLVVALLMAEPARLLVADLSADALRLAELQLGEAPAIETPMFSRALAAVSRRRLLAATRSGVTAVDVVLGASGPRLEPDLGFEGRRWRGPLAVLAGRAIRTGSRLPVP